MVNYELQIICEWFRAIKLFLNVTKTNYTLFHKNFTNDEINLKIA